jgi:hypothetical protein
MYGTAQLVTSKPYLKEYLGPVVKIFSPAVSNEEVEIKNVQAIASYSWMDEKTPTIAVPCTDQRLLVYFIG